MIKVNLLRDQAAKTRKTTVKPAASPMGWLAIAVIAAVALCAGGAWYYLNSQIIQLTGARDKLRVEEARLKELRIQIEQFEKMKQEKQSRIDIIEQLRANQKGPVILLSQVIRSIPTSAAFWLTSLEQKGEQIRVTGFTVRGEAIPDFMSNLSATGYFKTVDLELYEDKEKEAATFTLLCVSEQRKAIPE